MWRSRTGPIGRSMTTIIDDQSADVWAFTEARSETGPTPETPGFTINAGPDWGYQIPQPDRRKVMLWSLNPWTDVEAGDVGATKGRLIAGTTATPIGPLRVVGVCIPWRDSHVSSGRRNLRPWEDHFDFLDRLPEFLARQPRPCVIAGDFNQRIPPVRISPIARELNERLLRSIDGFPIATHGIEAGLLDHIAVSSGLASDRISNWAGSIGQLRLTDHWGACASIIERHPGMLRE
jgi:hypothetical protein